MSRRAISMTLWLPALMAAVVAGTVAIAAELTARRSQDSVRLAAEKVAGGRSLVAAQRIRVLQENGVDLASAVRQAVADQDLDLVVIDPDGQPLYPLTPAEQTLLTHPFVPTALVRLATANRLIDLDDPTAIHVALRVSRPASGILIGQADRAALSRELSLVRDTRNTTLLFALPLSVLAALVVAAITARRVRRLAQSAQRIAGGDYGQTVPKSFPDEVGDLAQSFELMRLRLDESFTALDSERRRLRLLLARLQQAVVAVDADLRVTFANEAACHLANVPIIGKGDLLPEPWETPRLSDTVRQVQSTASVVRERVTVDDGHVFEVVALPADPSHPTQSTLIVVTDLSADARRERAEREFVENAAHELRTPLSTIIAAAEVLVARVDLQPADQTRMLQNIRREALRLNRLSQSLLLLAQAQAGADIRTDALTRVEPVVSAVGSWAHPMPEVRLATSCPWNLAIAGSAPLLEQALENLVGNAVKYTRAGTIDVTAEYAEGSCVIQVRDTGDGIDPAQRDRLFDRLYRSPGNSATGFGLGLAIARASVEALGGTIRISSVPKQGTTVVITIPNAVMVDDADTLTGIGEAI